jgi:hypothetical protein
LGYTPKRSGNRRGSFGILLARITSPCVCHYPHPSVSKRGKC